MKADVMKTSSVDRIPYPNAVTRREFLHKLLDTALLTASGIGIGAMLALMLVL